MASQMPTILAPDPPDDEPQVINYSNDFLNNGFEDGNALSPRSAAFPRSITDSLAPPRGPFSPSTASTFSTMSNPTTGSDDNSATESGASPFNFQTQSYTVGSPPKGKLVCALLINLAAIDHI